MENDKYVIPVVVYHFHGGGPQYRGFIIEKKKKERFVSVSPNDPTSIVYIKVKYAATVPDEKAAGLGMVSGEPPERWKEGVTVIPVRGDITAEQVGLSSDKTLCIQWGLSPGMSD